MKVKPLMITAVQKHQAIDSVFANNFGVKISAKALPTFAAVIHIL